MIHNNLLLKKESLIKYCDSFLRGKIIIKRLLSMDICYLIKARGENENEIQVLYSLIVDYSYIISYSILCRLVLSIFRLV